MPDDTRLLAALGFMAARMGLVEQASAIFESLALIRPQASFPYVGLAIANLSVAQANKAVDLLQNSALAKFPDEVELRLWLAIAQHYAGESAKGAELFRNLQSDDANLPAFAMLAKTCRRIFNMEFHPRLSEKNITYKKIKIPVEI